MENESVHAIKSRLSCLEVASKYTRLKPRGFWHRGPCPLCKTSARSQSFAATQNAYKCHACGAGGDVLDLISALTDCNFRRALEIAKEMLGDAPLTLTDEEKKAIEARKLKRAAEIQQEMEVGELFRQWCSERDTLRKAVNNQTATEDPELTAKIYDRLAILEGRIAALTDETKDPTKYSAHAAEVSRIIASTKQERPISSSGRKD